MRWILWALSGVAIITAIGLGALLLGLARLNPWLARRLATGRLAAAVLLLVCETAWLAYRPAHD